MLFKDRLDRVLLEADVNRRDFLKKTGGTLASVLLSKGVDPELVKAVASFVASPGKAAVLRFVSSCDHSSPLNIIRNVDSGVTWMQEMYPNGRLRLGSHDHEDLHVSLRLNGDDVSALLSRPGVEIVDKYDVDGDAFDFWIQVDGDMLRLSNDNVTASLFNGSNPIKNIVKDAWDAMGRRIMPDEYVRDDFIGEIPELMRLAKLHGLQPPDFVDSWADFPKSIKAAARDFRRMIDASNRKLGYQSGDDRLSRHLGDDPEIRGDLGHGMHQDFDEFFEGRNRRRRRYVV